MKTVWIIGNGFDLNLPLQTSYEDFYKQCYSLLGDSEAVSQRNKLNNTIKRCGDPKLWSDLELLIGKSTVDFDSVDEHYKCFQRMRRELEGHLVAQQERFDPNRQSRQFAVELMESLFAFGNRLDNPDREALGKALDAPVLGKIDVVTLNYTDVLERAIRSVKIGGPLHTENLAVFSEVKSIVHAHGELAEPRQTVFAVSDASQIANAEFREDAECLQLWTKPKLDALYGNGRLDNALGLIGEADLLVSFGCSFGETDRHLWKDVGQALSKRPDARFLCFSHTLPEKGADPREYLRKRAAEQRSLAEAFGLKPDSDSLAQIVVCPSARVFTFTGDAAPVLDWSNADPNPLLLLKGHSG